MDSTDSAGNGQERNNNSRKLLRWHRRRYRARIWCLSPETWLAISFFLLVIGLSILATGYCVASDADRELIMKFGAFVLCSGWAALIFLVERVKSRNWCSRLYIHNPRPAFVGLSIPPPIQPEFLSAMLLPEIEREWVSAETLPGFEPRHAEIVRPPTQEVTAGEENGGEESRSKRRRNRKKKTNNSVSELDAAAAQESNKAIVQITTVDANQEDGQPRDLSMVGELSSKVIKIESDLDFNQPNQDFELQSIQKCSQPRDSNHDCDNPNKSQQSDQVRHSSEEGYHHSRLDDTSKNNSSAVDKVIEQNPDSDHRNDSLQTSEDSLQIANGLMSEESNLDTVKSTANFILGQHQPQKSDMTFASPGQTSVNDTSEQLNKTHVQLGNMAKNESDIPKGNGKPADETMLPNTTSGGIQQVVSKPVSSDFKTFTSKKRNRRRKK